MEEAKLVLSEYRATQQSAEHHDRLAWFVTIGAWMANLLLLGLLLVGGHGPSAIQDHLVNAAGTLGILLMLSAWFVSTVLNSVKRQKYDRCKALEAALNSLAEKQEGVQHRFAQHTDLEYPKGRLSFFRTVVAWLTILVWVIVIGF